MFSNPLKTHPCAEPRPLTYTVWKLVRGTGDSAVGRWKNPEKKKPSKHLWCAISSIRGTEIWGIVTKFCMWVGIQDLIMCAIFCDDRLKGYRRSDRPRGVWGRIIPVSQSTCIVALTTLALPCESDDNLAVNSSGINKLKNAYISNLYCNTVGIL